MKFETKIDIDENGKVVIMRKWLHLGDGMVNRLDHLTLDGEIRLFGQEPFLCMHEQTAVISYGDKQGE